jgi:uncharacterized protein with HEPN domain
MTRKRIYLDYLRDMLDATEKALRFTAGMTFSRFIEDDKTAFAVVRALEVLGEAAKKVPKSVRDRYPDLPWRAMTGIRDKLIHEYFGVNLQVVWQTIQEDLPSAKKALARMVTDLQREDRG